LIVWFNGSRLNIDPLAFDIPDWSYLASAKLTPAFGQGGLDLLSKSSPLPTPTI
jgi:hypothetical protein